MLQPAPPVDVLDRFAPLHEALLDVLYSLSAEQWQRPTACAGWSVHDVALHLLGGDVGMLSRGRDGYAGTSKQIADWDELVAFINDRNADWVVSTRRMSPRVVCDLLRLLGPQVTAYFHTLDLRVLGGPVSWAGSGPAPVWLDVAREYTERWHHQQHIREAVGAPLLSEPFFLAPALATFVHALPVAYREVDAPEGTSVVLTIAGDAGQTWCLQREAPGWRLALGQPERAASTVVMPQDIAWRLFTHGMRAAGALPHTTIAGDAALGRHMLDAGAIIA